MGCCASIPQGSVGMVERCGKFRRQAPPGLTMLCCVFGEHISGSVSLRVQSLNVEVETKTKDNVFLHVRVSVQYKVEPENVFDAYYRLSDPHRQITAYVYDVVRASVPKILLDDVFEQKEEIAMAVKEELSKSMEGYGFNIIQALITDLDPDDRVKAAMNEINTAERQRIAATDKAEAEKIMIVKAAEAEAESKYLAGVGISRQRLAIIEGLRESVVGFTDNVEGANTKDVMDLVLITQYFDTLKEIGAHGNSKTIFVPQNMEGGSVSEQVRNGFMEAAQVNTGGGKKKHN